MKQSGAKHARVSYLPNKPSLAAHEEVTHRAIARKLAGLKGLPFEDAPEGALAHATYWVPADTVLDKPSAQALRIEGEDDLFGGVVPFPFAATKAITHPLVTPGAAAPAGWSHGFDEDVTGAVLDGVSAFSRADARAGGIRILERWGSARVKSVAGIGGRGQAVVRTPADLEARIDEMDEAGLAASGVVIEQNMTDVRTVSVGQVRVGGLVASYWGEQRLTTDNGRETVYGGSSLVVVRGDFDALLRAGLADDIGVAVAQACRYDAAIDKNFPGAFASRRNYDVAQGGDTHGQWRSGVLEQSWRVGGASGAEIFALEAFRADPSLRSVAASTVERYGRAHAPPDGATVYFHAEDPEMGPMLKYAIADKPTGNTP